MEQQMEEQKWIGIFQAEWPLQCHTINSAIMLSQAGFYIDLFLYKTQVFIEIEQVKAIPNINIHIFTEDCTHVSGKNINWLRRIKGYYRFQKILSKILDIYLFRFRVSQDTPLSYFIPNHVNQEIDVITSGKHYQCFIGVEKLGLVWAGNVANKIRLPYLYHNLELYTKNHPIYHSSIRMKILKKNEEKYHKLSSATIIPDEKRAEVLFKDNGVTKSNIVYLPISLLGNIYENKSNVFPGKSKLSEDKVVIINFGQIRRLGLELTQIAQKFPNNWNLIIHDGLIISEWKDNAFIEQLQKIDVEKRVKFSLEKLNSQSIKELVASAHIGLVLYSNYCENDYLTVFSSEKLALYLQCGIPIIAFNYPGYEIIEQCNCGVLIEEIEDLSSAIAKILSDYNTYQVNAHKTFTQYYNFENNFNHVIRTIKELSLS